ncbi:6-carboxytetrahydropterin synthase QueD [candidate division KSB1 bacterium]
MYSITIEGRFSAAHAIKDYPGDCSRLHGHNYRISVSVESEKLDELGMAFDFHELQTITKDVAQLLDHQNLNELDFFSYQNPTAENIARFIYTRIEEQMPVYVKLKEVTIHESEGCSVTYREQAAEKQ